MPKFYITNTFEETRELAEKITKKLKPGSIIALSGELGAGKTQFIKGMAQALGISVDHILSPTFTIINQYDNKLNHMDFYRIESKNELGELGLDDYFYSSLITAVEWANKFPEVFPKTTIWINIEVESIDSRKIAISYPS